ncbi:MAG: LPS export ABC transporter permease LptF [Desulfobacterales bacterium]|nr:LPS export ABC transporter permease LptF [Desulfobacterales bacterium]
MKVNTIVSRYVFREMIPPFLINLILFTFIFLMAEILDVTDLIVNHRVSVSSVLLMLICSIPSFLVFVLPMSIMMGVLLAFLRLSNDNEITALKSAGLSIFRLLFPVFVFCLIGCLVTGFMSIYGSPWGRLSFKALLFEAAKSNIDIGLKERTFNDSFKNVMLYVGKIDAQDKTLGDVFIEDRQTPGTVSTVVAPKGKFFFDPERLTFRLRLFNGIINKVDQKNKTAHSVSFDIYDFKLEVAQILSARKHDQKGRKEMSLGELRHSLREAAKKNAKYYLTLMEYHKKFSIPFACFVFGLIAVPLGVQSKSAKRSFGMVLGLFFFLIYYIFLSAGWVFGEAGVCPPVVCMWGPNLVIGSIGLYLLILSAKERPLKGISVLPRIFMRQRFRARPEITSQNSRSDLG